MLSALIVYLLLRIVPFDNQGEIYVLILCVLSNWIKFTDETKLASWSLSLRSERALVLAVEVYFHII